MVAQAANSDGLQLTPRTVLEPICGIAGQDHLTVVLAAASSCSLLKQNSTISPRHADNFHAGLSPTRIGRRPKLDFGHFWRVMWERRAAKRTMR